MAAGSMMSETPESEGATGSEGAAGKAREVASQVQGQAQDLKGQAAERVRAQLGDRSTQAGEQLSSIVQALRKGGEHLAIEGNDAGAKAAHQAADQTDRLARYFSGSNAERLLADVERFARRKPWLAGAIGTSIGFMASRFLKASSERRYESARPTRVGVSGSARELPAAAADRSQ